MTKTEIDSSPILIVTAIRKAFPDALTRVLDLSSEKWLTCIYEISVSPISEPSFSICLSPNKKGFFLDGLNDQNERAAVAIRGVSTDTGPMIAFDDVGSVFVDLVLGMTLKDVKNGWRSWDVRDREVWS